MVLIIKFNVTVRPQLAIWNISRLSFAQTQDLELRQTSRDCAEHLEFGLHKLKINLIEYLRLFNSLIKGVLLL